jgi:hypothetical protein
MLLMPAIVDLSNRWKRFGISDRKFKVVIGNYVIIV